MAKVLHINNVGALAQTDPDIGYYLCDAIAVETGEDAVVVTDIGIAINMKTLGIYKTGAQVSQSIINEVKEYVEANHALSGFNKVYLYGAAVEEAL